MKRVMQSHYKLTEELKASAQPAEPSAPPTSSAMTAEDVAATENPVKPKKEPKQSVQSKFQQDCATGTLRDHALFLIMTTKPFEQ